MTWVVLFVTGLPQGRGYIHRFLMLRPPPAISWVRRRQLYSSLAVARRYKLTLSSIRTAQKWLVFAKSRWLLQGPMWRRPAPAVADCSKPSSDRTQTASWSPSASTTYGSGLLLVISWCRREVPSLHLCLSQGMSNCRRSYLSPSAR